MSTVTITKINPGDTTSISSVNNTINSWNSASADVDAQNVRDEGIDKTNIAETFQEFGDTNKIDSASGTLETHAGVTANFAEFTTKIHCGGFDYTATSDDELLVHASVEIIAGTTTGDLEVEICIGYKTTSAGAVTAISSTRRGCRLDRTAPYLRLRDVITITHKFDGPTSADRWFTLMWKLPVGTDTISFKNPTITAVLQKK
jgi:hypothetical protein